MVSTKKILLVITLAAMLVLSLVAVTTCNKTAPEQDLPALKLTPNNIQLYAGNSAITQIQGLAEDEKVVSWQSNDTNVVTVSDAGEITAVAVGYTTVKATTNLDRIALVSVTVKDNAFVVIPNVTLNSSSLTLAIDDTYSLHPQLTYDGQAVDGVFTWQSTNPDVATITNGNINAISVGSATIVCQATYDGQSVTAKTEVSVTENGFYFCADYQNKQIWQGDTIDLTLSQTVDGETTQIENVTFVSKQISVAYVKNNNQLYAESGGDVTIVATFNHNGQDYECKTTLHVYGKHAVTIEALGKKDHTIRGNLYGDKITLFLNNPVQNRAIKCWYVDGERIEGNTFIMPDKNVQVTAKYVNETEGDFTNYLTDGNLFRNSPEIFFNKALKTDSNGKTNTDGNYVSLTNETSGSVSVQLNLDEGIVITDDAYFVMRLYLPSSAKLHLGFGNTVRRTYATSNADYTIATDCWTEIKVPLTEFGDVDALLNNISIGLTGSVVYIDYVQFVY